MVTNTTMNWFQELDPGRIEELKLEFAMSLDKARQHRNAKKKDLAAAVGTSSAWITKVMRGDANPTLETMQKLADALDYNVHLYMAPKGLLGVWTEVQTNPIDLPVNMVPPALPAYETMQTFFGQLNSPFTVPGKQMTHNLVIGETDG
jgi:transcriptional regulator with XRE-family HTH domain